MVNVLIAAFINNTICELISTIDITAIHCQTAHNRNN